MCERAVQARGLAVRGPVRRVRLPRGAASSPAGGDGEASAPGGRSSMRSPPRRGPSRARACGGTRRPNCGWRSLSAASAPTRGASNPWPGRLGDGIAVACRPTAAFLAVAIALHVLWTRRLAAWPFVAMASIAFSVASATTVDVRTVQGGYTELHQTHQHGTGSDGLVGRRRAGRLAGLLVSPSRGLFVYSPVLLLGAPRAPGQHAPLGRDAFLRTVAVGVVGTIVMLGAYAVWWGGHSFGPRLLTDALPAMVLGVVPMWPAIRRRRAGGGSSARPSPRRSWSRWWAPSAIRRLAMWNGTPAPTDVDFATSGSGTGMTRSCSDSSGTGPRAPGSGRLRERPGSRRASGRRRGRRAGLTPARRPE